MNLCIKKKYGKGFALRYVWTGGIGTAVFSVSGRLLVLGAAAILAAQPKAGAEYSPALLEP